MIPDHAILAFDRALRTIFGPTRSARPTPGEHLPDVALDAAQKGEAAALMRVNHVGEVCAQALYQGQALTARNPANRAQLQRAAQDELDHLAWTERRLEDLGGRRSLLNPLWYAGSYAIGAAAGLAGDRWNLGFLAETEKQVVAHLDDHLARLPHQDTRSRAILIAMKRDETRHASAAVHMGGGELPAGVRLLMKAASQVMTRTSYWV